MKKFLNLIILIVVGCNSLPEREEPTQHLRDENLAPFYHGVASGDPRDESVVIWTRFTPERKLPEVEIYWEVASDPTFQFLVESGRFATGPARDYTVKVVVENLQPGEEYYYRFKKGTKTSETGKTRTTPLSSEILKFGVVSCSNYEWGYFNAYRALANEEDPNAIVHLGDYIYEYGTGAYGKTTPGTIPIPKKEIVSLEEYRTRYSQYRLDPDLRAAHANHPFITIWDDHEITNNAYKEGAQNHQPDDEGNYEERKSAAVQTYYEWLPIREDTKPYRSFSYGGLADLIMLDERLAGRAKQLDSIGDPMLYDSSQTMLGETQLEWFLDQLGESDAQWKVIGNQVIFSYLDWGTETFSINLDSWDGYPVERNKIAEFIKTNDLENIVFITGDTHSSWAFEATHKPVENYDQATGEGAYAVEFGTTSINSANSNERFPDDTIRYHESQIVNSPINPHLKYANLRDHGYLILELTEGKATATWKYVETLSKRTPSIKEEYAVSTLSGDNRLMLAPGN